MNEKAIRNVHDVRKITLGTIRVLVTAKLPACALLLGMIFPSAFAQSSVATPVAQEASAQPDLSSTMEPLVVLRDAFVAKATAAGYPCKLAPPKIELMDVASFGNYDPGTNTLRTPAWTQLTAEERAFFFRLAGPGSDELTAHRRFERGTHHWVFVHELGHWFQECTGATKGLGLRPYAKEYGANRIAAAYWREADPSLMDTLAVGFQRLLDDAPDPVPSGQSVDAYFNANYEKLAHTPQYTWFQAKMMAEVNAEKPAPTFRDVLAAARSWTQAPKN